MRREASARLIRNRSANADGSLPPNSARVGLLGELIDQCVFDGGLPATHLLPPLQYPQSLGGGQHIEGQIQGAFVVGLERVEHVDDLFPTTGTHVRIILPDTDMRAAREATLWMKLQLWITAEPQTGIPENITRAGSYFCRTALNRDRFGPKYRDAGWLASR